MNTVPAPRQVVDRPRQHRLLDPGQLAAAAPRRPAASPSPWRASTASAGSPSPSTSIGFSWWGPPGRSLTTGMPSHSASGVYSPLGSSTAMNRSGYTARQRLISAFTVPDLAEPIVPHDDHVRVLDQPGVVELERVEEEPVETGGDVRPEVDAGLTEAAVGVERVHRAQMGHRRAVPLDRDRLAAPARQQRRPVRRRRTVRARCAARRRSRRASRAVDAGLLAGPQRTSRRRRRPIMRPPRLERATQRQRRHPALRLAGDQRAQIDQRLAGRVLDLGARLVQLAPGPAAVTVTRPA